MLSDEEDNSEDGKLATAPVSAPRVDTAAPWFVLVVKIEPGVVPVHPGNVLPCQKLYLGILQQLSIPLCQQMLFLLFCPHLLRCYLLLQQMMFQFQYLLLLMFFPLIQHFQMTFLLFWIVLLLLLQQLLYYILSCPTISSWWYFPCSGNSIFSP